MRPQLPDTTAALDQPLTSCEEQEAMIGDIAVVELLRQQANIADRRTRRDDQQQAPAA
ncbi:MAG: hypothetical protein AABY83_15420 [Pseudomonadota bacterium]